MMPRCPTLIGAGLLLALTATAAHAGRQCDAVPPTAEAIARGMQLALNTTQALDAVHARDGTRVVVLARAGQDLTRYGQHWSHLGLAYKTPEGPWRVAHKLNDCGSDRSLLMRHGLGQFFLDDLWRFETAWVAPPPALQDALWALLQTPRGMTAMNEPRYSMVSYAWGTRYQQSNQWALETLALAAEPGIARRAQAQAWLQLRHYTPGTLRIGPLTRLGGRLTAGNVAFDDHPDEERYANRIHTITADSVLDWLPRALGGSAVQRLALSPP